MTQLLKSKWTWLLVVVFVLVGVLISRSHSSLPVANIGTVSKGDLIQRVTIAGAVNPNRKTVISAPYNGYVRKIYVQIGDHVKEGQPIVSVAQSLRGSSDDIYPLRAPFDGTVVQILKTEGEYVDQQNTGNAMVRIDDLTRIFVEASAPEIEFGKLKIGQEVVIKASAILSRSFKGKIAHISLAAKEQKDWDKSRVEFPVIIEVTDNDGSLQPGMSVIVDIITKKLTGALTLRQEFIQKDNDQFFVVTEDGVKKNITVGMQNEEAFEIKSGLSEGERIRQTDYLSTLKPR
jgi:cobalt-zinc-cadmium efflux system membrane fusion protein